jgi:hypothetical protein
MQKQYPYVLSIHPDPEQPLAIDLKNLLQVLGPRLPGWVWCIRYLEWLGDADEGFDQAVEAAGSSGVWLSSADLMRHAKQVYQTIEGQFLAFPKNTDRGQLDDQDLNLLDFPFNKMELAIVAIDGCFFEVYAKDPSLVNLLSCFKDVREEDPTHYFSQAKTGG